MEVDLTQSLPAEGMEMGFGPWGIRSRLTWGGRGGIFGAVGFAAGGVCVSAPCY